MSEYVESDIRCHGCGSLRDGIEPVVIEWSCTDDLISEEFELCESCRGYLRDRIESVLAVPRAIRGKPAGSA